jgi:thiosulfate/3-mercaptopyruvate sulfurtransferase
MAGDKGYVNGDLLWTPEQLNARLGDEHLVILDVRPSHFIMGGIIPGAAHFDLYGVHMAETKPELLSQYMNMMRSQFGLRGIGPDRTVVIYAEEADMRAARAFWLLEYMGHSDAHVLDGGIKAWRAAGLETTQEMKAPRPHSFPMTTRDEIFISADDLHAKLKDPDLVVLDTRTDDEWLGKNTRGGPRGGTIPGAVHKEWVHYLDGEGRFKHAAELTELFESLGVMRDKAIVPF